MMDLLILHGAIGSSSQFEPFLASIVGYYNIYTFDFSGHGNGRKAEEPFSIPMFADDVLRFLEENNLAKVSVFGYSMGGYVAMYFAKQYPGKVHKMITLATKYEWTEAIAAKEVRMLDPEKMEQKLPAFAQTLSDRHTPHSWKSVLRKTAEMMLAMGADNPLKTADFESIHHRCLLLLGDRDKMVTMEETIAVYRALPDGRLGILPETPHPVEQVDIDLLSYHVRRFLEQ